jgi:aspartate oxidase
MGEIRDLMWRHAGLFRTREGLAATVDMLDRAGTASLPSTTQEWRHRNLAMVARLIAGAALRREESRGGHFRADFTKRDDARWKIHVVDVRVR